MKRMICHFKIAMYKDRILRLTVEQVSKYCNVSKHTVKNWIDANKLPCIKIGAGDVDELGVDIGNAPNCIMSTKRHLDKLKKNED